MHMDRFDPIKMVMVGILLVLVFLGDTGMHEHDRVCAVILYNIVLMTGVGMSYRWNGLPEWTAAVSFDVQTKETESLNTNVLRCFRFAVGMILLSGMVLLRKSLWLCYDMRSHTDVIVDGSISTGCTTCDAKNAFLLSFTATAASMTGALAIIRPKLIQSTLTLAFSESKQCKHACPL